MKVNIVKSCCTVFPVLRVLLLESLVFCILSVRETGRVYVAMRTNIVVFPEVKNVTKL